MTTRNALVVGATGIIGSNLCERLLADGWTVNGLSRHPERAPEGTRPLKADLNDRDAVFAQVASVPLTHVFQATWTPAPTEEEAGEINGRHFRNVLDGVKAAGHRLEHVALVTGCKHYLGPFDDFGKYRPETPFMEDSPRLPIPNFYYNQEDELFAAAEEQGFGWSVHRPTTIVGYAVGALMNFGVTMACYGSICRETGRPFLFTGVPEQWNLLCDISDARMVAKQLAWAATEPKARNLAFNIANGDVFRWRTLWPKIAAYFGVEPAPYDGQQRFLTELMADAPEIWRAMAAKYDLAQPDIARLATWWHSDADFGRVVESISDMSRSRKAGFVAYQNSLDSFVDVFERLRRERLIPTFPA